MNFLFFIITGLILVFVLLQYVKLYKEKKTYQRYTENLKIANDHAEVESLKLQLHPHFLFNALNTLHHLILPANAEARKYVQLLADIYRYILKSEHKKLVLLNEELNFSEQYIDLLRIRYGEAIQFTMEAGPENAEDFLIIPVSIQVLIENAIKHNHFSVHEPLELSVKVNQESVTVKNTLRVHAEQDSLKIGLNNLSERCLMIANQPLIIDASGPAFIVSVPLIKYK